jgi:hypothetical protein
MLTQNDQFEKELVKLIDEEIAHLSENLSLGSSVQTIEDYRYQVGRIAGLRSAIDHIGTAHSILLART